VKVSPCCTSLPQLCLRLCLTAHSETIRRLGCVYFLRTMAGNATYPLKLGAKTSDSDPRLQVCCLQIVTPVLAYCFSPISSLLARDENRPSPPKSAGEIEEKLQQSAGKEEQSGFGPSRANPCALCRNNSHNNQTLPRRLCGGNRHLCCLDGVGSVTTSLTRQLLWIPAILGEAR